MKIFSKQELKKGKAYTEPQDIGTDDALFSKTADVKIKMIATEDKSGEYPVLSDAVRSRVYAKDETAGTKVDNKIIVNDKISLDVTTLIDNTDTAKNTIKSFESHGIYGVVNRTDATGNVDHNLSVRSADTAAKITVKVKALDGLQSNAYGIMGGTEGTGDKGGVTNLIIGNALDASFKNDIDVSSTNNEKEAEPKVLGKITENFNYNVNASGILGLSKAKIASQLDGKVTAKATSKIGDANAAGIVANELTIDKSINKDVTATASGVNAQAIGVGAIITSTDLGQTSSTLKADNINGKITATATTTAKSTTSVVSSAVAAAVYAQAEAGKEGDKGTLTTGNINKELTATAKAIGGSVVAAGIANRSSDLTNAGDVETGAVNAAIKATATSKLWEAAAAGISGNDVAVGDVKKDIKASATGGTYASASGIDADGNATLNYIKGKVTATATVNGDASKKGGSFVAGHVAAEAVGIQSDKEVSVIDGISGAITATANDKATTPLVANLTTLGAIAYGINAAGDFNGDVNAAIKASATSKAGSAEAVAISASAIDNKTGINKNLTATAKGGTTADAVGINLTKINIKDSMEIISGKISATATAAKGNATASGITGNGSSTETEEGNTLNIAGITKDINATAKANGTEGNATAIGIANYNSSASGKVEISGITSKITASATSKNGVAKAVGVSASNLEIKSSLGTVKAIASGKADTDQEGAVGWSAESLSSNDYFTGKATVVAKKSNATGLKVGKIESNKIASEDKKATAKLDITATAKDWAVGIKFTDESKVTLKDSKITTKATDGIALALYDATKDNKAQEVNLSNSKLTGDVDLGFGDDKLILNTKSKITGDVYMGAGKDELTLDNKSSLVGDVDMGKESTTNENAAEKTDIVKIHSGSTIKGNITNAEEIWFIVDDASSVKTAMWDASGEDSRGSNSFNLDISSAIGESATLVTLAKGKAAWDKDTKVALYLDGELIDNELKIGETFYRVSDDAFSYTLQTDKSGKTLQLAIELRKS